MTELFLSVHRFNQIVANTQNKWVSKSLPMISKLSLEIITNANIPQISPLKVEIGEIVSKHDDLHRHPDEDLNIFNKFSKFKYNKHSHENHHAEAIRIFISTQRERLKSGIGSAINKFTSFFGWKTDVFLKKLTIFPMLKIWMKKYTAMTPLLLIQNILNLIGLDMLPV